MRFSHRLAPKKDQSQSGSVIRPKQSRAHQPQTDMHVNERTVGRSGGLFVASSDYTTLGGLFSQTKKFVVPARTSHLIDVPITKLCARKPFIGSGSSPKRSVN